jgi:hypothetical protein
MSDLMRRIPYRFAYLLLLAVFVSRTAPRFWHDLRRDVTPPMAPSSSIDRILGSLIPTPRPSETVMQAFASLPADCRVIFVTPYSDDRQDLPYSAICYLTWPRQFERVNPAESGKFIDAMSDHAALLFSGVTPPSGLDRRLVLGPKLVLIGPPIRK